MKKVGVKFCGGCNPQINRTQVFKTLKHILSGEYQVVTASGDETWDKGVLICGCPAACADSPELRNMARDWVIVSGLMVEHVSAAEDEIPQKVLEKLA